MKKLLLLALSLFMCLSLAACTSDNGNGGSEAEEMVYVIPQDGEPSSMNPDATSDDFFYAIAQNMYPRLYKLTNGYEAIPDLATSYEISDGGMKYVFTLRENAVWTDGTPVTAADVVYTYNEIVAKSYSNASVFMNVATIEADGDYKVVFNMASPDSTFLANLSWYGTFVLPKHVLEGKDWIEYKEWDDAPVTCGPFKFAAWNKGTDVQLVRDDNYWGDRPYLDRVIYTVIPDVSTQWQAWLNGEVDEISSNVVPSSEFDTVFNSGEYNWANQEWPSPYYVTFNVHDGFFADKNMRMAAAKAINREEVSVKGTGGRKPANNYYISQIFTDARNDDAKQPDFDPEGAMALIEAAGYTKDADGFYTTVDFIIFQGFEDEATVAKTNLEAVGIKCNFSVIDYNIWEEQVWGNQEFDVTMVAGFQGPDVTGCFRRWTEGGAVNVNNYSRPEIEALVQQALCANSQEEINECVKQIQVYLAEDNTLVTMVSYMDFQPLKKYISGHPQVPVADGGSKEIAGFSELTYVKVEAH